MAANMRHTLSVGKPCTIARLPAQQLASHQTTITTEMVTNSQQPFYLAQKVTYASAKIHACLGPTFMDASPVILRNDQKCMWLWPKVAT